MPSVDLDARDVSEKDYRQWRSVLASAPEGSPYQLPEYLDALASVTNGTSKLIGVFRGATELLAGIGLYVTRSNIGTNATSRLLLYYNGPFVKPPSSQLPYRQESYRRKILDLLEAHLRNEGFSRIRFKVRDAGGDYRPFLSKGWNAKPVYSYVIPLKNLDEQWLNIDKNLRRLIRRGQNAGLHFSESGDFDSFFDMHHEMHERKNRPLYLPKTEFRRFVDKLIASDIARLFQISLASGEPVASQLVLFGQHRVAHTLAASARKSAQNTGCNPLLRWNVCEWLSHKGYDALDLTDAHNQDVARFKGQLGARLSTGLQFDSPEGIRLLTSASGIQARVLGKLRRMTGKRN